MPREKRFRRVAPLLAPLVLLALSAAELSSRDWNNCIAYQLQVDYIPSDGSPPTAAHFGFPGRPAARMLPTDIVKVVMGGTPSHAPRNWLRRFPHQRTTGCRSSSGRIATLSTRRAARRTPGTTSTGLTRPHLGRVWSGRFIPSESLSPWSS